MNAYKQKQKISIRFFDDREIRAVWDDVNEKWMFSVQDVISAVRNEDSYEKARNYWKYLKNKLNKAGSEVVSATTQLKLMAPDGKMRFSDVIDSDGIIQLLGQFPTATGAEFLKWFVQLYIRILRGMKSQLSENTGSFKQKSRDEILIQHSIFEKNSGIIKSIVFKCNQSWYNVIIIKEVLCYGKYISSISRR